MLYFLLPVKLPIPGIQAEGQGPKGDASEAREAGEEPAGAEPDRPAGDLQAALPDGKGAARRQDGRG